MKHFLIFILAIQLTLSQYDYGKESESLDPYNSKAKKDKKCTSKDRWKSEDGCNWCFCDKSYTLCTSMHCIKKKKEKLKSDFESCKKKPLGKFKSEDGCNWCYCIDHNTPICTQIECYKQKQKKSKGPNVCKAKDRSPGRFLHTDGCNWCYCIASTQMCTIMTCPKEAGQSNKDGISTQFVFPSGNFRFVANGDYTVISLSSGKGNNIKSLLPEKDIFDKSKGSKQNTDKQHTNKKNKSSKNDKANSNKNRQSLLPDDLFSNSFESGPEKNLRPGKNKFLTSGMEDPKTLSNWFPDYGNMDNRDNLLLAEKMTSKKKLKMKSLKELAQQCKAGSKFKDPFGCNWCTCIEDGVVICDQDDCGTEKVPKV